MPKRIIIDCDPGIDDAIAMIISLFDPRLEVMAITATAGSVDAERTTRNVLTLIEQSDPPRHPRVGAACDPENAPVTDAAELHGKDGLGLWNVAPVTRSHLVASDKLMADEVRANAGNVTLLCLGPLTNVAKMLNRDPNLAASIDRIIMTGGAIDVNGDVTAAAEFNIHFDPDSAEQVFRSPTTKTLIPLDLSNQLTYGLDLLELLPPETCRTGRLLREILPYFYRSMRHYYARETITLQAVVGWLMLTEPQLFTTQETHVAVETAGKLTRGALIADRRPFTNNQSNMEVATELDFDAARVAVNRALKFSGQHSEG
jgi:inosine-uridine nucleoside N-ribohydrolase